MTDQTAMVNRALQSFGSRTTVTAAELAANSSNEAIQANIAYVPFRRRLLRLAPWACAFNSFQLVYITSVFGTPENTVAPPLITLNGQTISLWAKGQPSPPWAYEYQYPVDCLRMAWVTPQTATGFASGIPITTAVTGGAPTYWQGPPVKYSIGTDQFLNVTGATVAAGGSGYAVGDLITLANVLNTTAFSNIVSSFQAGAPQGAPAVFKVTGVAAGAVTTVSVVPVTRDEDTPFTGSYFYGYPAGPVAQGTTTGVGTGATFNLTFSTAPTDQRVILTNQEFAIGNYIRDTIDENNWDDSFQEAFIALLGSRLCIALTGDKQLANLKIAEANAIILEARGTDANEGLKVNDVTPDWLRIRGIDYVEDYSGPYNTGFNWGAIWPGYT